MQNITAPVSNIIETNDKIIIPCASSYIVEELKNILYCEAQRNYSKFYFKNGTNVLVCKSLK